MGRIEGQPIAVNHNQYAVKNETVPWFRQGETSVVTVAPYPDHGRPVFLGTLIRTNPLFLDLAQGLKPEDSNRVNGRVRMEIERYLDNQDANNRDVRGAFSLSHKDKGTGKPDIQVAIIGNSFNDVNSLRLYYHWGEFNEAPAFFIDAVARTRDAGKVERFFEAVGYEVPTDWRASKAKGGTSKR